MADKKDRITCHILDTTAGKPAKSVRVRLEGPKGDCKSKKKFESLTDDDGRIKVWLPHSSTNSSGEAPTYTLDSVLDQLKNASTWTLTFDTEGYFGKGNTFFPEAVVVFSVEPAQHYHVPLLLSPYSYTTYRGS
jgi:5-hydroxyisourate hydrolase